MSTLQGFLTCADIDVDEDILSSPVCLRMDEMDVMPVARGGISGNNSLLETASSFFSGKKDLGSSRQDTKRDYVHADGKAWMVLSRRDRATNRMAVGLVEVKPTDEAPAGRETRC